MKYGITYMKIKESGLSVHDWIINHFDEAELMLKIESCHNPLGAETLLNKALKFKRVSDEVIAERVEASKTTGMYQINKNVFCCVKHGCLTYPHCLICRYDEANK